MSTRIVLAAAAALLVVSPAARADITYRNDSWPPASGNYGIFNNSQGTETEDCWVANAFTSAAGANHITQILFANGNAITNQTVTVTLYSGTSLTAPTGLARIAATTTTVSVTAAAGSLNTINLAAPADFTTGQIFWAAVLIRAVPGTLFPFVEDSAQTPAVTPLGHSFFDVGATQGAAYDLDVTNRATVLGAAHSVVSFAQDPGNVVVRALGTPAPGGVALLGLAGLCAARRRRNA